SAAAARAGYTAKNMAAQGSELMANPAVRERVRMEMQGVLAELRASALELMKQRTRAAFFDPGKLFVSGWEPRPLDELDEETRSVLEVSTVLRKSGPVVRVKQPDRHRALCALEKAHEKLERLNERYWAKREREGRVMSLEEIERMDADEALEPAPENAQKPMVLSGCPVEPTSPAPQILEKPQVLSGSKPQPEMERNAFSEKPQVLSGRVPAPTVRATDQRVAA
ncbi:MAG TPA: terminase small subunit, partial [Burkholderiales bacterium]|nr:terminase small subunit [Burkholderiales bacterium]